MYQVNELVEAKVPVCPCTGKTHEIIRSKILKVITNKTENWYYLDCGKTVKESSIIRKL